MNILLDSHVLLWWLHGDRRMSAQAFEAIAEASVVSVSLATPWELQIKVKSGKLGLATDWFQPDKDGIEVLDITLADVLLAADLPLHHRDPFDRLIVAQAMQRHLVIVTRDAIFARYGIATLAA